MKQDKLFLMTAAISGLCLTPLACDSDSGGQTDTQTDTQSETGLGTDSNTDGGETSAGETSAGETSAGETSTSETANESYPAEPYGTAVGDVIANLEFVRGDGELLALDSFYAQPPPALIVFNTASW